MAIIGNGMAGLWSLGAHWLRPLRGRVLWWFVIAVEAALFVQVALGVGAQQAVGAEPVEFHTFYGFVALIAVAVLYSYRSSSAWVREHQYLVYGAASLFIMGLGIRAFTLGNG